MPKLLYTIRTSPCAGNPLLQEFDIVLRTGLETILNVQLSDLQWMQASLPVHMEGLGVRSACSLVSFAFLASVAVTLPLQDEIFLASSLAGVEDNDVSNARATWNGLAMANEPIEASKHIQRAWDTQNITAAYNEIPARCALPVDQARLKALTTPHAGVWLHCLLQQWVSDYQTRPSRWRPASASAR